MGWLNYIDFARVLVRSCDNGVRSKRQQAAGEAMAQKSAPGLSRTALRGAITHPPRLLACDGGSVSVEFMLWMPLVFLIILFTIDVALIYLKQADMWNVARDQARQMSVSTTYNPTAAQLKQNLFNSLKGGVTATQTGATLAGTNKVVTFTIPLCQTSLFHVVGCFDNTLTLTARVTMASEY